MKADLAPVYIVGGMVCVAVAIGTHTAFQQLFRSPAVHVNKNRRETVPEVSDPDRTINSASKFIDGSFLRKVSHIQENKATLHDPVHPNPFTRYIYLYLSIYQSIFIIYSLILFVYLYISFITYLLLFVVACMQSSNS